jgi:hypothetical protein
MHKRLVICLWALFLSTAAFAQNPNDFLQMFGGVMQQAMRQAAFTEWQKLPPSEFTCVDQRLHQSGGSVNDLINRGVFPSDPRLRQVWASCGGQAVQVPQLAATQSSLYVVDGLALGGQVHFESDAYRRYRCGPSDKFPGFTWCHKEETKQDGRNQITLANSILHTPDGTAWYINRYIEPATFGPNDVRNEIDRLSAKFGRAPVEYRMPRREGLPDAIIAVWGNIKLEPLGSDEVAIVAASGSSPKGLLVSFLGDLQRSAKAGVPVYRLGGGAGFLWAATFNQDGRGVLRFLAIDASQIVPPIVSTNPIPQPLGTTTTEAQARAEVGTAQAQRTPTDGTPQKNEQEENASRTSEPAKRDTANLIAQNLANPAPGPVGRFSIQTPDRQHYVTAVGGGGIQGPNSLRTDATAVGNWETFTLVNLGGGQYAIQTFNGNYLTAVFGGGVGNSVAGQFPAFGKPDAIHTDARRPSGWERFALIDAGGGRYAIRTMNGHYLTALNGGGIGGPGAFESDANQIGELQQFTIQHLDNAALRDSTAAATAEAGHQTARAKQAEIEARAAQAEADAEQAKAQAKQATADAERRKQEADASAKAADAARQAAEARLQQSRAEAEAASEKYENEQAKLNLIMGIVAALFIAVFAGGVTFWLVIRRRRAKGTTESEPQQNADSVATIVTALGDNGAVSRSVPQVATSAASAVRSADDAQREVSKAGRQSHNEDVQSPPAIPIVQVADKPADASGTAQAEKSTSGAKGGLNETPRQSKPASWPRLAAAVVILVLAVGGLSVLFGYSPLGGGTSNGVVISRSIDDFSACDSPGTIDALKLDSITPTEKAKFPIKVGTYREWQNTPDEQIAEAMNRSFVDYHVAQEMSPEFFKHYKDAVVRGLLATKTLFADVTAYPVATGCAARVTFNPAPFRAWIFLHVVLKNVFSNDPQMMLIFLMKSPQSNAWDSFLYLIEPAIESSCVLITIEYALHERSVILQKTVCERKLGLDGK